MKLPSAKTQRTEKVGCALRKRVHLFRGGSSLPLWGTKGGTVLHRVQPISAVLDRIRTA